MHTNCVEAYSLCSDLHFMSMSCTCAQDTRVGDFTCAVAASASNGSVACNTFLIAKYSPAQPSIYDREYAGMPLLHPAYVARGDQSAASLPQEEPLLSLRRNCNIIAEILFAHKTRSVAL